MFCWSRFRSDGAPPHRVTDHRHIMSRFSPARLGHRRAVTLLPGRIMHAVVFGPWQAFENAVLSGYVLAAGKRVGGGRFRATARVALAS
jgi:hypothetical protein